MKITKPSIKRFALVSFIYSTIFTILFTVLIIVALLLPDTASKTSVIMLIFGDLICLLLCAVIIVYYCIEMIYEIEITDEGIAFRSLLKKHIMSDADDFDILNSSTRYLVKSKSKNNKFCKTLYLYREIGFKSNLFNDEDIKTVKSWREAPEAE